MKTEKQVEAKFLKLLRQRVPSAMTLKLNGLGQRGWPDRLVTCYPRRAIFVEFKRPGGTVRKSQWRVISELRAMGHVVLVGDDPGALVSDLIRNLS